MANVPFSTKTIDSIVATAIAPFNKTKSEIVSALVCDDHLMTLIHETHTNKEQTQLVAQLHALNPAWLQKSYVYCTITAENPAQPCTAISININTSERPIPELPHRTIAITADKVAYAPVFKYVNAQLIPYWRADTDATTLTTALKTLFDNCLNLNGAIKIMPNIINWCDDDLRKRLNAFTTKPPKRTKTAEEIMTEAFGADATSAAARARILK